MVKIAAAIVFSVVLAAAHPGIAVVVDSHGNIFYTDLKHVWKVNPQGKKSIAVRNVHTHELYLDAAGNLFGEHLWYEGDRTGKWGHRVWRLSSAGELTDVIPATEGFLTRYSFVRDAAGNMYRAGPSDCAPVEISKRVAVCRIAAGGTTTRIAGPAGFADIRWMAASPDGTVYLIDSGKLWRMKPNGAAQVLAGNLVSHRSPLGYVTGLTDGNRHALMGLWPDSNGDVYVASSAGGRVLRVAPSGTISVFYRSSAAYSPTGVTVTKDEVVVLEYAGSKARVQRLRRDGSSLTLRSSHHAEHSTTAGNRTTSDFQDEPRGCTSQPRPSPTPLWIAHIRMRGPGIAVIEMTVTPVSLPAPTMGKPVTSSAELQEVR